MKGEMGGACSTYGGEKRYIRVLVMGPEGKREFGILGIGERIILKWIIKK